MTEEEFEAEIARLKHELDIAMTSIEVYGLDIKCPKCGHYHMDAHVCLVCGFDHTAPRRKQHDTSIERSTKER